MGFYDIPGNPHRIYMNFHGIPWDFIGTSWNVMIFNGIHIEPYVIACKFMDFHDVPWKIPRIPGNSMEFTKFRSIFMGFHSQILQSLHGIPWNSIPIENIPKIQEIFPDVSGMSRGMSRECLRNAPGMSRNCRGNVLAMSRERSRYVPGMS